MNGERILKVGIFAYLLIWFIGGFWGMAAVHSGLLDARYLGIDFLKLKEYVYYGLSGAIGGVLYELRIFHEFYHRFNRRWAYWYVMRPFLCGGTAIMIILLFKSGIMLMQVPDSLAAKVGLSFLVGYGFGKVIDKIKALTETLFNGKKQADPNINDPVDKTERIEKL
ncbi:hypothetical protein JJB07_07675 [Tumebacillus sp. ITR2]|uniref:DUF3995 domain-containing protein n=1 Tax=Tumebacillus amylolyticus TaxID=2801339 RepID=A0ABS1J8M4_9BACL|nr:hypothetical protein [Tumebacillus amylolyticus]MBL0386525.1 hypothetical protein [Tumebacillus amylolyticus]